MHSPLFLLEIKSAGRTSLALHEHLEGEIGICVVEGAIEACNEFIEAGNLLVTKDNDHCNVIVQENTHLLVFGGQPFEEERHIYWNFVSTDSDKITKAKEDWVAKNFDMIPGDKSYIPLPGK